MRMELRSVAILVLGAALLTPARTSFGFGHHWRQTSSQSFAFAAPATGFAVAPATGFALAPATSFAVAPATGFALAPATSFAAPQAPALSFGLLPASAAASSYALVPVNAGSGIASAEAVSQAGLRDALTAANRIIQLLQNLGGGAVSGGGNVSGGNGGGCPPVTIRIIVSTDSGTTTVDGTSGTQTPGDGGDILQASPGQITGSAAAAPSGQAPKMSLQAAVQSHEQRLTEIQNQIGTINESLKRIEEKIK